MTFLDDSDEKIAQLIFQTRCAERVKLARRFTARLSALADHIHRYELTGTEAAELLLQEEERMRTPDAEVH
ncbi:DUF2732 family protein [Pluralibacter gergoviae]|uniref:DUF2732 family protein n=1 Tax=Pluralibacter gergoviae TaxID=61647 RepID=A0AAW8HV69_PLUGE|nr:DUF2732 family protein [Pluralibacter gergoviae]AIR00296.1 hypothetical protein LG71_10525 [Pluralibacter gergoviae]AVR05508.1 DUF2732 domain-containing protein [Pluralibacter gergoviae]EKT9643343.1 DUF2732 family protein [Pluralibacter gergoviae]EKV0933000.1 DUF2732 family protein [Pluralibacter gergoviae]EKV3544290.1 DUF2732 family protein [Pluralibacter gergoviae]